MRINQYSQIEISEADAVTALYNKKITNLENVYLEDHSIVQKFNHAREINADRFPELKILEDIGISIKDWDQENQANWFMPESYKNMDIESWLFEQCSTDIQKNRVQEEFNMFTQHQMIPVLRYIKYLVDTMRKENIVWGVGRGSSVASYILFLIGIHKIDSIRYELDIHEFLK